jgi:hypothetical protein
VDGPGGLAVRPVDPELHAAPEAVTAGVTVTVSAAAHLEVGHWVSGRQYPPQRLLD